ncbi:hypothetical protein EMIT0158MI4_90105 [Burkholderia ambifaria]
MRTDRDATRAAHDASGNDTVIRHPARPSRLIAYRKAVDHDEAVPRALDADRPLLADPREAAADFRKLHVHNAVREKTGD